MTIDQLTPGDTVRYTGPQAPAGRAEFVRWCDCQGCTAVKWKTRRSVLRTVNGTVRHVHPGYVTPLPSRRRKRR